MFRLSGRNTYACGTFCWFFVIVGLALGLSNWEFNVESDLGGLRPESAIVKQCPAVFDANNESVLIAGW